MMNSWHRGIILPVETDVRKETKGRQLKQLKNSDSLVGTSLG